MFFNSFSFLFIFLPMALAVALRLRGQFLLVWVAFCSFVFYAFAGHVWFLIPMFITTVLDFFLAQKIAVTRNQMTKKLLLLISLCGTLGLLFYFKYLSFLVNSLSHLSHILFETQQWNQWWAVILPAGISFYSFQTLAYVIDVYRGQCTPETNFWRFASFVSFFPHLVAGPIARHDQLIPPLEEIAKSGIRPRWEEGIFLLIFGLAKKVLIADRVANLIDPIVGDMQHSTFLLSWLAMVGYALQIYFDFSGYSDMAIGLGRLFGIELPQNFNSPYQSLNPRDFWARWHITLSLWLRDYLYIPLGGNREGRGIQYRNVLITMVLGGLWHGASWTFALWGLFHGTLLILYHLVKNRWDKLNISLQKFMMFLAVCLGWVFFRSKTFEQAGYWYRNLFGLHGLGLDQFVSDFRNSSYLLILIGAGLFIVNLRFTASYFEGFAKLPRPQQIALGGVTLSVILLMNYSSSFLYYQF